jgi:GNAT superfamily N-acetyltransferase
VSALRVETRAGADAAPFFDDLARLRIEVFRAWPYLYDGDLDYERRYLATYAQAPDSLFVLAIADARVVGVSTAMPLDQEAPAISDPWRAAGVDPATVFYFGESVLLPAWRGRGIGHRFFDQREAQARRLGRFERTSFCAVERPDDHPLRPPGHRALTGFWTARGYRRHADLACTLDWREVGGTHEVGHRLAFWSRPLASLPPSGDAPG